MKKLLLLLGVGLFLQSCSVDSPILDENTTNPEAKLYDVTLEVSNFDVTTKSTADNSVGRYVEYKLYEGKTREFIAKEGSFTPTDFTGEINLKLAPGTYTLVVFASDKPLAGYFNTQHVTGGNASQYLNLGLLYSDLTQDLFRGQTELSVSETNISQMIIMERPIARVNLALDDFDKIPSNVESLTILTGFTPVGIALSGKSQFLVGGEYSVGQDVMPYSPYMQDNRPYFKIAIPKDQIASYNSNNPFSFNILNNQNVRYMDIGQATYPDDLYLYGFDKDVRNLPDDEITKVVYKKLIKKDIQFVDNQSLTITGSLLENGVTISVNDEWDSEKNEINF